MQRHESNPPDRAAEFIRLYAQHQRELYYYIVTLCTQTEDANDVLAETNLVAWQNFDQFEKGSNFLAWIRQIARYRVIAQGRVQSGSPRLLEPHVIDLIAGRLDEQARDASAAQRSHLSNCLEKLKTADRQLIQRRYSPDGSVKQLAAESGRSPNAISQSLRRIRGLLYDCIRRAMQADREVSV